MQIQNSTSAELLEVEITNHNNELSTTHTRYHDAGDHLKFYFDCLASGGGVKRRRVAFN